MSLFNQGFELLVFDQLSLFSHLFNQPINIISPRLFPTFQPVLKFSNFFVKRSQSSVPKKSHKCTVICFFVTEKNCALDRLPHKFNCSTA